MSINETRDKEEAQEPDNIQAFYDLLEWIDKISTDPRDKGTRFENLILDYLRNEPTYKDLFTEVQTWAQWTKAHPEFDYDANDIGIDLVATDVAPGEHGQVTYSAIQCKFYAKDAVVPKAELDSFLSASNTGWCKCRYVFATNSNWSANLKKELEKQFIPVEIVAREALANSVIDWAVYHKTGKVVINKRTLRPYQQDALKDVIEGLKTNDRGKLIMACGTGKTFTSLKIAEKQTGENGFVLFLVPSLSLLSQTLSDWKQQSARPMKAFAVCSDSTIGKKNKAGDVDSLMTANELNYPATTDAVSLAKQINNALSSRTEQSGMTVIFSTYQSIDVIAVAQNSHGMQPFDLVICDEAHRTAGGYLVKDDAKERAAAAAAEAAELSRILEIIEQGDDYSTASTSEPVDAQESASSGDKPVKSKSRKSKLDFIDEEEAVFTRIHNNDYVHAKKRLYMTATPKIYGEAAKKQKETGEAVLYSMDDVDVFGPVLHSLNFDKAVSLGCLVDYKVVILVADSRFARTAESISHLSDNNAARIVGAWKALNKYGTSDQLVGDHLPMRRAVGFAQVINPDKKLDKVSSKAFTDTFETVVNEYRNHVIKEGPKPEDPVANSEYKYIMSHDLHCDCRHIDGSMNALEKGALLQWLREEPENEHCKILFNVRCLSEGVDVPALDAVIFLSPRKSQVDVVQTVGRVMRRAPGKKRGYVIIPVVASADEEIESVISRTDQFAVVWQVLRALKAINPNHVIVDGNLEKIDERIEVVCIDDKALAAKAETVKSSRNSSKRKPESDEPVTPPGLIDLIEYEQRIKSSIVRKLGNRREWEDWADDVAEICKKQVEIINNTLNDSSNAAVRKEFEDFRIHLSSSINGKAVSEEEANVLDADEVIDMLAQHVVIKPILDKLFPGYPFAEHNPVARALSDMLMRLDSKGLQDASVELKNFYDGLEFRMQNVRTLAERQSVVVDLFDRFFKVAFPKQQEKLGIVYTPVEVVDFINHSVNDILKKEFNQTLANDGVHVLDPFTGTGTFITRLMQSEDIIPRNALANKYYHDLHAFELMPLAYYVASINMESVFHDLVDGMPYQPNNITVLTDTFALHDEQINPLLASTIAQNTARRQQVDKLPIRVIIGNPPYSIGQKKANDDNQNDRYFGEKGVDTRITDTYVSEACNGGLFKSMYDSYIKAFRWASDRIGDQGIVAFVTNAGWMDAAAANGMRKCLKDEFSSIYIYHLKGNQRTSGEQSRKEGGKIFGAGSRAPIAITILVKNPASQESGRINFACVDDYMSREEKLLQLASTKSVINAELLEIVPDDHNDWFNQRREDFGKFITVDGKKTDGLSVFRTISLGVNTNRDAWSFQSGKEQLESNFETCINFYNSQVDSFSKDAENFVKIFDAKQIKWSSSLESKLEQKVTSSPYSEDNIKLAVYRPFFKQFVYWDKLWIDRESSQPKLFPYNGAENLAISVAGVGAREFSCLMVDQIPCLDMVEKGQCLPRYVYTRAPEGGLIGEIAGRDADEHGYVRTDGINAEAVEHFRAAYPEHASEIDADAVFYYIYGILHNEDYRTTYANNLMKELPRIPRVATWEDFSAFEQAGRKLADLHVNYESVEPYKGCELTGIGSGDFRVNKMAYGKVKGKTGDEGKDRSMIVYNNSITISKIPLEVQEYVVNKKSALDWVLDRCCVKVDKESGIINDFNDYAASVGDEQYILKLILRVITVSLETVKTVRALPKLTIHKLDQ